MRPPGNNAVYIADVGIVSPWGLGLASTADRLIAGDCCLYTERFEGVGEIPVGRCAGIEDTAGEDRAITLLRVASGQIQDTAKKFSEHFPPERRGASAATSKGAILLYLQDPERGAERWPELWPDAPARFLMREFSTTGPSAALVGACATGLHNVLRAADWVADGIVDFAIAGSTEATLTSLYLSSFVNMGAMDPAGCRPYDRAHRGFVPGEGAAVFLLCNETAAEKAGVTPLARLRSWATGAEALHQTAVGAGGLQVEQLLRTCLKGAGLLPGDIDLLAAHGTGTVQNDTAEAAGVRRIWGADSPSIVSTKGAIGHLMGATGSIELAAAVASIQHGIVPATVGFRELAEECEGLHPLMTTERRRIDSILKWNLGFGGHLAGCVVEKN